MAPSFSMSLASLQARGIPPTKPTNPEGLVLAAWAQGFMVGAFVVMACITIANMRKGVLLHKLILLEICLGIWHGTYIFLHAPVYGWYLSATAALMNISWSLHNVIAWIKNKPFLSPRASRIYISTVILGQLFWVVEIYASFAYFQGINKLFDHTRPWETLFRDPWWIYTTCSLFYNISTRYEFSLMELVRISPRFGILLVSMLLSIVFTILDLLSCVNVVEPHLPGRIDPFWELAFVFKLLTDSVVLDDFKTALDRLHDVKLARLSSGPDDGPRTAPSSVSLTYVPSPAGTTSSASGRPWEKAKKAWATHVEDKKASKQAMAAV